MTSLLLIIATCSSILRSSAEAEVHPMHRAVHVTELMRRHPKASNAASKGKMQVQINAHGQLKGINITTPLKDMTSEYTGMVGVGTKPDGSPQFEARVVFDTGSTNLWIASVLCQANPCRPSISSSWYNPALSMTQEEYGERDADIDIEFGTGELKGPLHVDTYQVGPLKVKQQPFAMIREMTGDVFSAFQFEGILGLAFKSLSFGGIEPFFERVIQQKLLEHNEFAFYLNADSQKPSALLWGGVDKGLFEPPIIMFPVVQTHYWALELVDLKFGSDSLLPTDSSRPTKVIIDSGTTYFTAPRSLFSSLMSHIPEAACREVESYPDLIYVLRLQNGTNFDLKVTQRTYMVGDSEHLCYPAFMRLDVSAKWGPAMILGEVFMRHFFTVFSRGDGSDEQAQIGIAEAKSKVDPAAMAEIVPSAEVSASLLESSGSARLIRRSPPQAPATLEEQIAKRENQMARETRIPVLHET